MGDAPGPERLTEPGAPTHDEQIKSITLTVGTPWTISIAVEF